MDKERIIILVILLVAFLLLTITQGSPSFLMLLPILLFTLVISWYLYSEIQKDHEENLKRGVRYIQEEQEAQVWLHKSFVPRMRRLAKKELQIIIIASLVALMGFIFIWSFFVGGLLSAILNSLVSLFIFLCFIIYALYVPKEFDHIAKRLPRKFRHHGKNDWAHAYILLFPFAIAGFLTYSLTTTGEGFFQSLESTIEFIFSYTFIFICIYCLWFLYKEYQRENEEALKKTAKKILKEED
jgi:hypothetical protein